MAILSRICNSYKTEILEGIHEAADVYKIALYTSSATLGKDTTVYSTTNEVTGTGYSAGGVTLAGYSTTLDGDTAILSWDDALWQSSSITARGALIYNSTRAGKAVLTMDFGADIVSSSNTFKVKFPELNATTGLLRLL